MRILGLIFFALAGFAIWFFWVFLNPSIQAAIPNNDWHSLISIVATFFVIWVGGIGLPLTLFFMGLLGILKAL